ncbi:olfactory receptor 11A1-like [Parambassis ranga]|uniref:Olfactory receptor 11A1-like n=1 Tax=Parambassis ranga TaxID=210632 RepID=A0A6P7JH00_9TELE|nr:olfactory receptor 11A1-like [Parambassis ranga]
MMLNSTLSHFILGAYLHVGSLRYLCFTVTALLYAVILAANLLLILVICVNRSLHEPMYMFLCSLFVNELYGSTGLFPSLLLQILSDIHTVSAPACFLQVFCVHTYVSVQLINLGVMSYDRYLAICCPLQYNRRMSTSRAALLVALTWVYSFLSIVFLICLGASLQLCGTIIHKVYCDNYSIVKLACSDTTINNLYGLVVSCVFVIGLIVMILFTYVRILQVCFSGSRQTRQKAVSTCTPHLASLLNFSFGCLFEVVQSRFDMSRVPSLLRVILSLYFLTCPPLFNPVVYGLKITKIRDLCKHLVFGQM